MSRIKYILSEQFYAKAYPDGMIVAFKTTGESSSSYADQIHQIVKQKCDGDLYVPDVIECISGSASDKDCIEDSLFVYLDNEISISAGGVNACQNGDGIEVQYNSELFLVVEESTKSSFWLICVLCIVCGFLIYALYPDKKQSDEPINEPSVEVEEVLTKELPVEDYPHNNADAHVPAQIESVDNQSEKQQVIVVPNNESKKQREREEAERTYNLNKEKVDEYVKKADKAYKNLVDSYDEGKKVIALENYKKALELNENYSVLSTEQIQKINDKIKVLSEQ